MRLSGRLRLPAGVTAAAGCTGIVRADLRRNNAVVARRAAKLHRTRRGCRYARTLRLPRGRGKLVANARFTGNAALLPRRARAHTLRG